ncbi:MAG: PEP-CTERM sorting domain-containing protein [Verrucomicrobiota bacterium]
MIKKGLLKNLLYLTSTVLLLNTAAHSTTQFVDLSTNNGTGSLYITNIQSELVEPNSGLPGSKPFEYPYYWDPSKNGGAGVWVMIVSEQLSASTTYSFEEANFNVLQKTITDSDFGIFDVGDISYDDTLLTGSGTEVLGLSDFTLSLDLADFSPLFSPRNINNEFAWDYAASIGDLTGAGLTFVNGELTSIDFVADIAITPQLLGSLPFGSSYDGLLTFSGNSFAFDVDVIQDNTTALGPLENTHLVFDAQGNYVIPEPSTWAMLVIGLATLLISIKKKIDVTRTSNFNK